MFEDRLGGDIEYIKGKGDDTHSYFEKNKTQRHSTQLTSGTDLMKKTDWTLKIVSLISKET